MSGSEVRITPSVAIPPLAPRVSPAWAASSTLGRTPMPIITSSAGSGVPSVRVTPVTAPSDDADGAQTPAELQPHPVALDLPMKGLGDLPVEEGHDLVPSFTRVTPTPLCTNCSTISSPI